MQFIYWPDSISEYMMLGYKCMLYYIWVLASFFFKILLLNFNGVIMLKKIIKRSFKKIITKLLKRLQKMLQKNPIDLIKIQFHNVIKVFKRPNYMN